MDGRPRARGVGWAAFSMLTVSLAVLLAKGPRGENVHRPDDAVCEPERPYRDGQHEQDEYHAPDDQAALQQLARVADRLVRPEELGADRLVAHPILDRERREDRHQQERPERHDPSQLPSAVSGVVVQQAEESHCPASYWSSDSA